MTVLDAYAVLAYLRDERAADAVGELLTGSTTLTAVNAAEVLDQLVRVHGRDADDVHADLAMLAQVGMQQTGTPPIQPWQTSCVPRAARFTRFPTHAGLYPDGWDGVGVDSGGNG